MQTTTIIITNTIIRCLLSSTIISITIRLSEKETEMMNTTQSISTVMKDAKG